MSDHTESNHACFGAVALGASILERHFTDSFKRKGPDICCSMDPHQLSELISGTTYLQKMRGGSKKNEIPEEDSIRDFAFATIVAKNDHRIAMSFNLLNLFSEKPIKVIGNKSIMTSFPDFFSTLKLLKKWIS